MPSRNPPHHRPDATRTVLLSRNIRRSRAVTEIFSTAPKPREARTRVTPAYGPDLSKSTPTQHPEAGLETDYRANARVCPCRSGCFSTRGCRATPDQQGIETNLVREPGLETGCRATPDQQGIETTHRCTRSFRSSCRATPDQSLTGDETGRRTLRAREPGSNSIHALVRVVVVRRSGVNSWDTPRRHPETLSRL